MQSPPTQPQWPARDPCAGEGGGLTHLACRTIDRRGGRTVLVANAVVSAIGRPH